MTRRAVTYASYLKVPELLALQVERSGDADGAEHDELLFIVIHQVYELWFKQVRHELRAVQGALEAGDTDRALHLLNRVLKIHKTLAAQVDVLETMTPLQFLSFRDRLDSASGFHSAGVRQVEAILLFLLSVAEQALVVLQLDDALGGAGEQRLAHPKQVTERCLVPRVLFGLHPADDVLIERLEQ